jgi:ligand-binding SRPBCC domain-containing protein
MAKKKFTKRTLLDAPPEKVFDWHKQPQAFQRLCPPWAKVDIFERTGGIADGAVTTLLIHAGSMKVKWKLQHTGYLENRQFCDYQVEGPLRSWFHRHIFEPGPSGKTYMVDEIEYELPFGMFGAFAGPIVESELKRLFDYRHKVLKQDIEG